MSEDQLRDVLARVVPEAPDSVADPAPVVRAARARRRAQVALAGGAVAVIAVAAIVGGRALVDDDQRPQVVDDPPAAVDPYSALPCPETLPDNSGLPEERSVVAVRFCAVDFNGFPAVPGPQDALVEGVGGFVDEVEALPNADPARCAAVDVMPTDSRLLLELADGSLASMPTGLCQDTTADARTVDAAGVTQAFLRALDAQRDDRAYEAASDPVGCDEVASTGPVRPGREHLVSAMVCGSDTGVEVVGAGLETLDEAWSDPTQSAAEPCTENGEYSFIVARTDRGDVVRLEAIPCGYLEFYGWEPGAPPYRIALALSDLNAS